MLAKFSAWFDKLKEPNRFFVFCGLVFGWYFPATIAMFLHDAGREYNAMKIFMVITSACLLFFMFTIAIYRATRK